MLHPETDNRNGELEEGKNPRKMSASPSYVRNCGFKKGLSVEIGTDEDKDIIDMGSM